MKDGLVDDGRGTGPARDHHFFRVPQIAMVRIAISMQGEMRMRDHLQRARVPASDRPDSRGRVPVADCWPGVRRSPSHRVERRYEWRFPDDRAGTARNGSLCRAVRRRTTWSGTRASRAKQSSQYTRANRTTARPDVPAGSRCSRSPRWAGDRVPLGSLHDDPSGGNQIGQDDVALDFQMFDLLSRGELRPVGSDPPGVGRRIGRFDRRSDCGWRGHGGNFPQENTSGHIILRAVRPSTEMGLQ
jgi:hypothetical protein